MIINKSTSSEGEALLIQFSEPWMFVQKILSCTFDIKTESEELFYYKEFRWSIDGFSFTDFIELGKNFSNLLNLVPPHDKPFFLQFRLTQIGEGELVVESLDLNILQNNNEYCINSQVTCCDANSIVQGLVFNNCGCNNNFNPYNLGNTGLLYEQLCGVVSNLFGICCGYYKVDPDQKSRDVILKEYSLYNVIDSNTIKIVIPDNELPSRNIEYHFLQLDFPAQFEVHIVKTAFEQAFGKGSRPQQHDYLYFEQYMNRMYEVDAVAQPDDVIYGSAYWRVSLVPYQKRTAVGFDNAEELKIETEDIVTNIEDVFKEEREVEYKDTRKPNQYRVIGTLCDDYVRSYINPDLRIEEHKINMAYTVVSKYYYDLNSIPSQDMAIKYRFGKAFIKNNYGYVNGSISFFIQSNISSSPKTVLKFLSTNTDNTVLYAKYPELDKMQQLKYNNIHEGDILSIERRKYIVISSEIKNGQVEVKLAEPLFTHLTNFVAIKQPKTKKLLDYNDNFSIKLNQKQLIFNVFGQEIIPSFDFENDNWYAFVINYNNMANQFSIFVYKINNGFEKVYKNTWQISNIVENTNGEWALFANECKFTNFRIWKSSIEEDEQKTILQQYVINDTHLTSLIDNASPELLMQKTK